MIVLDTNVLSESRKPSMNPAVDGTLEDLRAIAAASAELVRFEP